MPARRCPFRVEAVDVVPTAEEANTGRARRRRSLAPYSASALSGSSNPMTRDASGSGERARRREQLAVALLDHQPSDGADDDVVDSCRAELVARPCDIARIEAIGVEAGEIDAVARAARVDGQECAGGAARRGPLRSAPTLRRENVAAMRSKPYTAARRRKGVIGQRVETVDGVDDRGRTGDAGCDPAVHAWLRIVRVNDVRAAMCGTVRTTHAALAASWNGAIERVACAERYVLDASRLAARCERTRCGCSGDAIAGARERRQLRPEQELEAHVRRRDVDHERRLGHVDARAYRTRFMASRRVCSKAIPPATLRSNQTSTVVDLDGRSSEPVHVGVPGHVGAGAGKRRRAKARLHSRLRRRGSEQRLRIGEVARRSPEVVADRTDRTVEFVRPPLLRARGRAVGAGACASRSTRTPWNMRPVPPTTSAGGRNRTGVDRR